MRIISKFHDYYDSALAAGIDKDCLYIRRTEKIDDIPEIASIRTNLPYSKALGIYPFVIYFCDVIYIGYADLYYKKIYYEQDISKIKFDLEDKWAYFMRINFTKKNVREAFNKYNGKKMNLFLDCPIILYGIQHIELLNYDKLTIKDPLLKGLDFFRIIDSYTAFQDIFMYISGVVGNNKKVADLSNEEKIKKAGFDKKSFRKEKKKR